MKHSRRQFVKASVAGTAAVVCGSALLDGGAALAKEMKLPLGLQLYSVRDLLPKDYAGTLKEIGGLGFREVESAGYFNHSAAEVRSALDAAGLKLVSAHYASDPLHKNLDEILAFNHELGVSYIICAYPGKDPAEKKSPSGEEFSLADWRWNADQFNQFGEKVKSAGMKFGYHNHKLEFRATEGAVPYEELMRLTDPAKVTFEMDLGWVVAGGGDPIALLKKYGTRISMLHVKDFTMGTSIKDEPVVAELGHGSIDYRPIFAEIAKSANIRHCFVEQEAFTVPPMESLKMDADYMRKLGVVA
jgi:sugar phosphate isomerase/epimerase